MSTWKGTQHISEMQIKTTVKSHYTYTKRLELYICLKLMAPNIVEDAEQLELTRIVD